MKKASILAVGAPRKLVSRLKREKLAAVKKAVREAPKRRANPARKAAPEVGYFISATPTIGPVCFWNGVAWVHTRHAAMIVTKPIATSLARDAQKQNPAADIRVLRADTRGPF